MFSVREKREIAEKVQEILRATGHPELPEGEIQFALRVDGAEAWSWADIRNNGQVPTPGVNPHNEAQDKKARNAVLTEALMGLAEMVRVDLIPQYGRLSGSNAYKQALAMADGVLANKENA